MPTVLVIGGVSVDVLHLIDGSTHTVAGGAGLYTALATQRAGANTTLLALRPDPMPAHLQALADRVHWIGPTVTPEQMPRLEIKRFPNGHAELVNAFWGGGEPLSIAHLPKNMRQFDAAYIAPLASDRAQQEFCEALRNGGIAKLAGGTYARACQLTPDGVRHFVNSCDAFFMNDNEAAILYPKWEQQTLARNKQIFVTQGAMGVTVLSQEAAQTVLTTPKSEVDATGAGDTFAGTTLTHLLAGEAASTAAQLGCEAAGQLVQHIGPAWHFV